MSAETTIETMRRVPDLFNAVQELWIRAAPVLSDRELEWFARCGDSAQPAIENISNTLEAIGCCIASDETSDTFKDPGNVSELLFFIAESMRGINALVFLKEFASNRLHLRRMSG